MVKTKVVADPRWAYFYHAATPQDHNCWPNKTPWFSNISGHSSSEYLLAYIDITVSRFSKVQSLPSIVEILENEKHGQDLS